MVNYFEIISFFYLHIPLLLGIDFWTTYELRQLFYFIDDEVDETKPKIDSISSGYPTEELMERFAEIVKGRTYLHRPNQSLNLYLTAALAVSFFLVIGLGFGHFKGKKNSVKSLQNKKGLKIFQLPTFRCLFLSWRL